jgi:hypothetical protein
MVKHVSEIRNETLSYIVKRKDGLIKSVRTPWIKLNSVLMDGLEWSGIYIIAGRPGCLSGETIIDVYRNDKNRSSKKYTLKELYYKFNGIPIPRNSKKDKEMDIIGI